MNYKNPISPLLPILASFVLLAVLFRAPVHAAKNLNAVDGNRDQLCKQLPIGKACGTATESHWNNPPVGTVESRNGVKITTKVGAISFSDVTTPGSESAEAKYKFAGFLTKPQYFLVSGIYHGEEQDYKLVSYQTGVVYSLRGHPVMSPNGDLFFVIPRWHGSVTTNIELYKVDVSTVVKVDNWDFKSCPDVTKSACYGLSQALWISQSEVAAFINVFVRKGKEQVRALRYVGSVKREGDHWAVNIVPSN